MEVLTVNSKAQTKRETVEKVFNFIVNLNPPEHGVVPRSDLEKIIGAKWLSQFFAFVVQDVIDLFIEAIPSMLFRRDEKLGLIRLTESERIDYVKKMRRQMMKKNERSLLIIDTTDTTKLSDIEVRELDRERLRQLHLKREAERVNSKRWIQEQEQSQ